ncbi:MAG: hypothetical protein H8D90_01770 [Candidatus Omnitrophica bacterium]|nr:hypothetical protein [Candidatus Omnitrophota bacterium]MBL7151907.1 hypothetical protein [Candidatus Omnitrophota bacterium]
MRQVLRGIFLVLFFTGVIFCFAYAQELQVDAIVDEFKEATDVQRQQLRDYYRDREIIGFGTVDNVREYNTFDEVNDIERRYYEIISVIQKTAKGNPYKVIFLYKNLNKVKGINKGQVIERSANILRIIDDRLWISVWLYEGELTPEEKAQFRSQ